MSIADDLKAEVCGGCEHADLRTVYCDICRADAFVPVVAELERLVIDGIALMEDSQLAHCDDTVVAEMAMAWYRQAREAIR